MRKQLSGPAAMSTSYLRAAAVALTAQAALSHAQTAPSPAPATLAPVRAQGHYDNAVGSSDAASQGRIENELLKSRPALRPGEVLEYVPGVIVTQHSGDGKANQYFLRGFNLDHGTDFATWVDGMPVNMPSHGHGQGYSDINFLIPELVDYIDYRKGPYFARNGDFSLAGSADIAYRRRLDAPFAQLTLGENKYARGLFAGSTALNSDGRTLMAGLELLHNDGPWTLAENLKKLNGLLTLSDGSAARGWSASFMGYDASWQSTDQVPLRAIADGTIDRFGHIDPTDGGNSSRYSLSGEWRDLGDKGGTRVSAYLMRYELQLFSNFTYAMDDPVDGDQFEQKDERTVAGVTAARTWNGTLLGRESRTELGAQLRHDRIRVGLHKTRQRDRLSTTREDDVQETGLGLYGENSLTWTPWLRSVLGLRADAYRFDVNHIGGSAATAGSGTEDETQLSPKLSVIFGPWARTEFFVNAGRGFHSNDARGVTDTADPVPGLVAGRGGEIGVRTEAIPGLQSSLSLWQLKTDSELVYVGDAGATEAGRPGKRTGIEWNNRWIPASWFLLDADLAWTRARYSDESPDGDRIAGAVERAASVSMTVRDMGPWFGTLQFRYLGPRPLIEDNSERSSSSLLTNLRVGRKLAPHVEFMIDVFNLFDREVNDIEYFYESQLPGEGAPVADRHIHPAEPRTLRATLLVRF
jgi:hypothetical protein